MKSKLPECFGTRVGGKTMHCPHCDRDHKRSGKFIARYNDTDYSRPVIEATCERCGKTSFPKMTDRIRKATLTVYRFVFDKDRWVRKEKIS